MQSEIHLPTIKVSEPPATEAIFWGPPETGNGELLICMIPQLVHCGTRECTQCTKFVFMGIVRNGELIVSGIV